MKIVSFSITRPTPSCNILAVRIERSIHKTVDKKKSAGKKAALGEKLGERRSLMIGQYLL
jgi:hypothetical protein